MTEIDPITIHHVADLDPEAELARLTTRYRNAGGLGIDVLNLLGGQAEGLLERLPVQIRDKLDGTTELALTQAMRAAQGSRKLVGEQQSWLNTAIATALGAAGGAGGLPGALAELPVTTTILLRAIQDEAQRQGFDPQAENVQFDCVRVFAAAGPLAKDDGADLAFVSTRLALTGGAMQALIARVAPRLSIVLGQKLAAQAVPILGAVAGAATNYAYTSYYQEIAHVHFGLRRLAIDADLDHDQLVARMLDQMKPFRAA
ncbi:EcsC family protein [Shimia sp.]|uniref:EcsC family protein n=1 Tax=Shimia sp. TaxID=1954381 RepID=UPI0032996859